MHRFMISYQIAKCLLLIRDNESKAVVRSHIIGWLDQANGLSNQAGKWIGHVCRIIGQYDLET